MKTIVTFLIALLAFASTLAWAGPEQGAGRAAGATTQSQPLGRQAAPESASAARQSAKSARQAPHRVAATPNAPSAAGGTSPVSNYGFELPAGPAVICACTVDKTLG